jgi:hypothetical protein
MVGLDAGRVEAQSIHQASNPPAGSAEVSKLQTNRFGENGDKAFPAVFKGAIIGGVVGGAVGFALFEIGENLVGICDSSEPTCNVSPTRAELVIGGIALGALTGVVIAHLRSKPSSSSYLPMIVASPNGGFGLQISLPSR